ncbi:hypothetical protein J7I96_02455 [Bacillus sp. ISL-78]|nr:hypothetical protein [Bacillus sp. ISL-78]MBT2628634.1 hypothetical protein [Bacillus sp. ISL-101]MBT2715285.1 hypothetical protein [Bacillus sp. ISL-57]
MRHHQDVKPIYAKRKETILRGLKKLSMHAVLTFAAINLKKMASWTWRVPKMA